MNRYQVNQMLMEMKIGDQVQIMGDIILPSERHYKNFTSSIIRPGWVPSDTIRLVTLQANTYFEPDEYRR